MFLFYVLSFFKKEDTIQEGTLFKGGHYTRKYGCYILHTSRPCLYFLKILLNRKYFIFLLAFYLIMWLMKSLKTFEKIAILKIWQFSSEVSKFTLVFHRCKFWQLRRKPAVIFSKWLFFQNSLMMSWAT